MINWSSVAELARDTGRLPSLFRDLLLTPPAGVFEKLICSLFGLYVWELFVTIGFEWSLFTGRRRFTWPLVRVQSHPERVSLTYLVE